MGDANKLNEIAYQAEAEANTYQSKTGKARKTGLDDGVGVNSNVEQKFPGAKVVYGEDLTRQAYGTENPHRRKSAPEQTGLPPREAAPPKTGLGSVKDIATKGMEATRNNVGLNPPGVGGSKFKGENYYNPESVPDSISAEGWVPPESVTQASRETEGYGK